MAAVYNFCTSELPSPLAGNSPEFLGIMKREVSRISVVFMYGFPNFLLGRENGGKKKAEISLFSSL
jgi:hypothetical protein